ncbi:hypothetical protein GLW07_17405 [Bacillus hwajinpoensis]|uniref:Uncharacterized protein n=1 Tax=Guptibacillus hwajinpoensis TaxID=208199 RepID=A0A845F3A7_9BACL|nr:hypothetical protein [Pseudalkalibacillus hwajinpoensis]MYL65137.1 hypothetical protein [Pseudalkalibacillus hwajinpoensis]
MDGIALIGVLIASGLAIVATVHYGIKAYHHFLYDNKGINQNTSLVECPKCGTLNKRHHNDQQCKECYISF